MESRLRKNRDIWLKNFLILFFSINLQTENLTGKTVVANQTMVVTRHYLAPEVGNQVLTKGGNAIDACLLYTSPSPRDPSISRMPSSA